LPRGKYICIYSEENGVDAGVEGKDSWTVVTMAAQARDRKLSPASFRSTLEFQESTPKYLIVCYCCNGPGVMEIQYYTHYCNGNP
jgi:hypothetical protein